MEVRHESDLERGERRLDRACWSEFVRMLELGKFDRVKECLERESFAIRIARCLFLDLGQVLAKVVIDQLAYEGWEERTDPAYGNPPRKERRVRGFSTIPIADFASLGARRTTFPARSGGAVGSKDFADVFKTYEPIGSMAWGLHDRLRTLREILHAMPVNSPGWAGDQLGKRARKELSTFGLWLGIPGLGRPPGSKDRNPDGRKRVPRRPDVVESVKLVDEGIRQKRARGHRDVNQAQEIRDVARRLGVTPARIKKRVDDSVGGNPLRRRTRRRMARPKPRKKTPP